jgi:hypothetical protein
MLLAIFYYSGYMYLYVVVTVVVLEYEYSFSGIVRLSNYQYRFIQ